MALVGVSIDERTGHRVTTDRSSFSTITEVHDKGKFAVVENVDDAVESILMDEPYTFDRIGNW